VRNEQFVRQDKLTDKSLQSPDETNAETKTQDQNLWIVTELYYPEETSTGYYLTRVAEGLAVDFRVKVLCGQPNYSGRGIRAPKREIHNEVEIFRAFGTTLDKNVILYRLINMLTLSFSVFWKALLQFQKEDKILVVTTPPSLPFITALACLLRGGSYVLLIHDNYPEILIAVGKTKENSWLVKVMDFFNRWLYKYAAKVIVVGRDMEKLVEKKTEGLDIPIDYIPNWAELEQVRPEPRGENILLKELNLENKFVFLYAGNMGHPNDLESIVRCAEHLKADEKFHFVFLGAGVKRKWLEREVLEKELANVTLLAPRPRSEQNVFLNACDVAIVSLVKKMRGVSMPSRTYNILAVGKPILALAEEDSEVAKVVLEDKVGWIVPPDEPEKLLEAIIKIYDEREKIKDMEKASRKSALEKYSLAAAIINYKNALK
jgi:colanic acid biosynthesis glycosyl transferase WcaI